MPGVGREGFNVASLPLGIKSIQRQARFAGSAHASYGDQLFSGEGQAQIFEIILPGADYPDGVVISHG